MKKTTAQLEKRTASGLVVLAVIVGFAKLAHVLVPAVPGVVWALAFGALAGAGAARARGPVPSLPYHVPLTAGFVMMGAQVRPEVFTLVGWQGLLSLAVLWLLVVVSFALAVKLRLLPSRLAGLFALGLSGCGVTAVTAVARYDRTVEGTPATVATLLILLSGAIALVAYPYLGAGLGLDASTFGTFAGLTVANNAEALATAGTAPDPALLVAAAYKVLVNAFEGLAVLLYLCLFVPRDRRQQQHIGAKLLLPKVPGFVVGFAVVGTAALLGAFDDAERATLAELTNWAFFIALVGVGYRTRLSDIFKAAKPTLVGLVLWAATSALVLFWLTRAPA
ncbi:MAG: putative sulfate exporter family transporter [Planctomycetes bacterium]|nr:putative sulfate exporter family transporter [Planctomycetota bacterium]MCW8136425.1 putative sulfate exporter family transporter [Planctomycetota bacterium]